MRQPLCAPGLALRLLGILVLGCGAALAIAPVAAQTAQAPAPKAAAAGLPAAREIIDRHIREIGGRDAILAQSSTHLIGTVSMPAAGLTGKVEEFHAKPNKYLQRTSLPGIGDIEEGFDGKVGWSNSALTGPTLLDGKQLQERAFDADFYGELKASDRYASMTTEERTVFEDRPAYKVRLVKKSGGEDVEYYDVESGLKIGTIATRESPMGAMQGTASYGDYKPFGLLRQPSTLKMKTMNVQMVLTILTLEYGNVDPAVFALPAPIKALLK